MAQSALPDFVFEVSWEVCNKVGGIYTVLSSCAKTMATQLKGNVIFIGPDTGENNTDFVEDVNLSAEWEDVKASIPVRIGHWQIPGNPMAVLTRFSHLYAQKNKIYGEAWNAYGVDSLHAYGDYDESSMFSVAAAKVAECIYNRVLRKGTSPKNVVYQAHEWMSGLGMLYIKSHLPQIATVFTTHATSIGRSIVSNEKQLYKYLSGYNGDQMAGELNMESKHSIEKKSAFEADCFTTVSDLTNEECVALLEKPADIVLPNGFEGDFVPKGAVRQSKRKKARKRIFEVVKALTGMVDEDALIVSTSGRNDYRCKGFDVYLETISQLRHENPQRSVLALVEVPCWVKAPRNDLQEKLKGNSSSHPLENPFITHTLHNMGEDRILNTMRYHNFANRPYDRVKVLLIPCYLNGNDGIFDINYYDLLTACDLCIYPSYYEPWGYTPLESAAFGIPTITTNLAGFGLWARDVQRKGQSIEDGVCVINRNDDNYFESVESIKKEILKLQSMPSEQLTAIGKSASDLAKKAAWKEFFRHYKTAFNIALENRDKRNKKQ